MEDRQPGHLNNKQIFLIIIVAVIGIALGSIVVVHFEKPRIKDNALGHMKRDSNGLPIQPTP